MTQLSDHFTLDELTRSEVGIRRGLDNTPPPEIVETLRFLASKLEEVRAVLNAPMHINSAYRGPKVNAAVGGAPTSQHSKGEAADFVAPGFGTPLATCRAIVDAGIDFDQLIYEGSWVHVSFTLDRQPRRQVLTAHFEGGRVRYTAGLP